MAFKKRTDDERITDVQDDGTIVDTQTGEVLLSAPSENVNEDTAPVVGRTRNVLTEDEISSISTVDDLLSLMKTKQLVVEDARVVLSDGSQVIEKKKLQGRAFYIVGWKFVQSKQYGGHFVVCNVIVADGRVHETGDGQKCIITDGGHGIYDALVQYYMENGSTGIISCEGLHASEYPLWEDEAHTVPVLGSNGEQMHGRTWYID